MFSAASQQPLLRTLLRPTSQLLRRPLNCGGGGSVLRVPSYVDAEYSENCLQIKELGFSTGNYTFSIVARESVAPEFLSSPNFVCISSRKRIYQEKRMRASLFIHNVDELVSRLEELRDQFDAPDWMDTESPKSIECSSVGPLRYC